MRNFKLIVASLITIPLIFACGNSKDSNTTNSKESVKSIKYGDFERVEDKRVIVLEKEKKDDKILKKMGIDTTNDGKIVIEPNKTKEFLKNIATIFATEAKKLKDKNSNIKSSDLGIEASRDKIIIDTKKSKKFLEKLSHDLDEMAKDLEKSFEGL